MSKIEQAEQLLRAFVARTGLNPPSATPRRYLWTDAFAVCNLITLHQRGRGDGEYLTLARKLVDQEHYTFGRRWEGMDFTRGGLRIGKSLPERQPAEPPDREFEWNQDGQYFHSSRIMTRATSETKHLVWAIELAEAVHPRFTHSLGTRIQHDTLDALVTDSALRIAAREAALDDSALDLSAGLAGASRMCAKGRQLDGNGQTRFKNRERLLRELKRLKSYENLADRIEEFWMKEENRMAKSWTGHEDINAVMLATALTPDAFLEV
ncbi:hypothetical protein K523DRAFT_372090 [Schizophyllum commune Tattone D]|nr:hypothetical protein K523DRAFT_372090 [Schizophyllum commune Tattone D]